MTSKLIGEVIWEEERWWKEEQYIGKETEQHPKGEEVEQQQDKAQEEWEEEEDHDNRITAGQEEEQGMLFFKTYRDNIAFHIFLQSHNSFAFSYSCTVFQSHTFLFFLRQWITYKDTDSWCATVTSSIQEQRQRPARKTRAKRHRRKKSLCLVPFVQRKQCFPFHKYLRIFVHIPLRTHVVDPEGKSI